MLFVFGGCISHILDFGILEHSIRYGLQPDNPNLLVTFIDIAERKVKAESQLNIKRLILLKVQKTLLDTICDTYIPEHWRRLCLDNIYKPLHGIEKYSFNGQDKEQVKRLSYELRILSQYFL